MDRLRQGCADLLVKMFGKPCVDKGTFQTKFCRFHYKVTIFFYVLYLFPSIIFVIFNPSQIAGMIAVTLLFPITFRVVYKVVLKMNGLKTESL